MQIWKVEYYIFCYVILPQLRLPSNYPNPNRPTRPRNRCARTRSAWQLAGLLAPRPDVTSRGQNRCLRRRRFGAGWKTEIQTNKQKLPDDDDDVDARSHICVISNWAQIICWLILANFETGSRASASVTTSRTEASEWLGKIALPALVPERAQWCLEFATLEDIFCRNNFSLYGYSTQSVKFLWPPLHLQRNGDGEILCAPGKPWEILILSQV